MSRCLRDRTLWLLSEGEASREDRAHVASCVVCAARLRRLEQDLTQLKSVLSEPLPPPQAVSARLRTVRGRWTASAAALAAMIVLAWFGVWRQQPLLPTFPLETSQESIWPFIEGVSAALFPTVESAFVATPDQLSDLDDLQAAMTGEWPCEGPEAPANLACDEDAFALLLGEL